MPEVMGEGLAYGEGDADKLGTSTSSIAHGRAGQHFALFTFPSYRGEKVKSVLKLGAFAPQAHRCRKRASPRDRSRGTPGARAPGVPPASIQDASSAVRPLGLV